VAKSYPSNKCIGSRDKTEGTSHEYVWKTYKEVAEILESLARGIHHLKLLSEVEDEGSICKIIVNLGWLAHEEIMLTSMSLWHLGGGMMCDTEELKVLTEIHTGFATKDDLDIILSKKECGNLPGITNIIISDSYSKEHEEKAAKLGIKFFLYKDILKIGREHPEIPLPGSKEDDIIGVYISSGTTGSDKVILYL